MKYMPRIADEELSKRLDRSGALLVRGPKWCGKTSTCQQVAKSSLMLRDPDVLAASADALEIQPSLLLRGGKPRLIDEWQVAPVLWDTVINAVDVAGGVPGQYILTGSATPLSLDEEDAPKHTGTGRIARMEMDTMTLEESGDSSKDVSLAKLFEENGCVQGSSDIDIEGYAELICNGGWPAPISFGRPDPGIAEDYIEALCETDVSQAANQDLDSSRTRALLRSLARCSAQEASLATLLADVQDTGLKISDPTLRVYLNALRRLYVITDIEAWAPNLRSKTPLRKARVWHLCDPSLAAAALGCNAQGLLNDLNTMGHLFETLCVRDLRVYARPLGGRIYHYRDKNGLEADAVIQLNDGHWAGIEVKLGGKDRIEEGAGNLLSLSEKVDHEKMGAPSFLMVLTGGKYAYTRPDGVHVVPLGCLAH